MKYFDHDTEAHKDERIVLLRRECGGAAVDAYWTLLEIIYREESEIKPNDNRVVFASVCFFLQTTEEQLAEWIEAMCRLGLFECQTDESGEMTIMSPRAAETIGGYKNRCKTNATNGAKGGRPRKTPVQDGQGKNSKTEQKPNGNPTETDAGEAENPKVANWVDKEKENKKENKKENIKESTKEEPPTFSDPFEAEDDGFAKFCADVLKVFNEETGSSVEYFNSKAFLGLRRIFDTGRTLEDVRAVTRDKRDEWGGDPKMSRFIRPSTIYGDKFEEYLAITSRQESEASAFDEYA